MITRRDVTRAAALTALSYSRILGANDRIGVGVIGIGNRGSYVMSLFQKNADVEVRALCDIYGVRRDQALQKAPHAKTFNDHRELLALKEVDAVLIASPDHWHKDHSVDAMNAGKDVYQEKPMCRTREEAPQILRAARVTGRVCQIGLQQRSGEVYLEAKRLYVTSGAIGKVSHIDAVWHEGVGGNRPGTPDMPQKPDNLDWVRFLGNVRYREWAPAQYFHFRSFLDFNGGKTTDYGHHWMDVVNMYMGENAPHAVTFAGGLFYPHTDGRTAPDTCNALFEFDGFTVLFQSNAYAAGAPEYGVTFYGNQGKLFVNRNRYEFTPVGKAAVPAIKKFPGDITADHVRNFLDCCKSRNRPNADTALASISILAPLLAVQSYEEQRRLRFDPVRLEVLPL
jgi:predicted dehydrogenase